MPQAKPLTHFQFQVDDENPGDRSIALGSAPTAPGKEPNLVCIIHYDKKVTFQRGTPTVLTNHDLNLVMGILEHYSEMEQSWRSRSTGWQFNTWYALPN